MSGVDGPVIDVIDETFIRAPRATLVEELCNEDQWAALGYQLECYDDRGLDGRRWTVAGALTGTAELWLEPVDAGVLVHLYVRADPRGRGQSWNTLERRWIRPVKHWILRVKARHDTMRPAGTVHPSLSSAPILNPHADEES